ncbi:hypothetical protein BJ322DRAFT_283637 [Thelephora terrestris]|uniref:Uncharacterized protein n=1 Tax=Thelephora terrestris TaxID=56493 RepID=A0A9P6H9X5_9AGAM|nr:hypothetical protein BJ322DRAFT_283637 [Thelephora terrestris]
MSFFLPQEILHLIIDHLHDEPETLRTCCLVSTVLVQRARRYLFAKIDFRPPHSHLSRWEETFPDPTSSPAHHARTLSVIYPTPINGGDADVLRTFCGVVHFRLDTNSWPDARISLLPFHGFSPVIRSLHLKFSRLPTSEILNFICSFPSVEDLTLVSRSVRSREVAWDSPPTSPRFTGSLELDLRDGFQIVISRLLDLPNGLRFKRLTVPWLVPEDVASTTSLVSRCSNTLEYLSITNFILGAPRASSIDLSKATKLRDVLFRCTDLDVQWITTALRTAKFENIQRISLDIPRDGMSHPGWSELDSLLVRFWTSRPRRVDVVCDSADGSEGAVEHVAGLLPQITGGPVGLNFVERSNSDKFSRNLPREFI